MKRLAHTLRRVVGVDQQHRLRAVDFGESTEGLFFIFKRHGPGVCRGAVDGNAKLESGERVRGPHTPANVAGSRGQQAGLGAVGAARAEFHDTPAGCRLHNARGLGRHGGLVGQHGEQVRFGDLRLDDGRCHPQQRLLGKHHRAFGRRPQRARKAKLGQEFKKRRAGSLKGRVLPEKVDLVRLEREVLKILHRLLQPCGQ